MKSFFLQATTSGWYPEFLNPVVNSVLANPKHKRILDIGTGPGTLPKMLITKMPGIKITGIDIKPNMVDEARKRVSHKNVSFEYQVDCMQLPFADKQFDVVTFCSVLFLLDDSTKSNLMNEAFRVLKQNGKIIILTPSGRKAIVSSFTEVLRFRHPFKNFTFIIWKLATTHRGRQWRKQQWLEKYAEEKKLQYASYPAFKNNAEIQIIHKSIHN
jgi:ubiquinone/menaquinone biosynthesis C-methylase UbiE